MTYRKKRAIMETIFLFCVGVAVLTMAGYAAALSAQLMTDPAAVWGTR